MRKLVLTCFAAGIMTLTIGSAAFAGEGSWMQNDYGYWWQRTDGSYPTAGWSWIDGNGDGLAECYHFDAQGYMDSDLWIGGDYVNDDGAWTVNGEIQTRSAAQGIDEWSALMTDYEALPPVNSALLGKYEMHTELVDCYATIENGENGTTYLVYEQHGFHEDGSSAEESYIFELQEVSNGHYVGDEYRYSGDMISFDWYPGMDHLENVMLNGMDMTRFYKKA